MVNLNLLRKHTSFLLLVLFLISTAIIIVIAQNFFQTRYSEIIDSEHEDLAAIASLKQEQIETWRNEVKDDALMIVKNSFFISAFVNYKQGMKGLSTQINDLLNEFKLRENFSGITILDTSLSYMLGDKNIYTGNIPSGIVRKGEIVFSDLYLSGTGKVFIDLYVPLISGNKDPKCAGILVLQSNPETELFPLIQSWPTKSNSSEILLVTKEGDSVVYLNKLRHVNNKPLKMKFLYSKKNLPAAMAVNGKTGIFKGVDYRGKPVLSDLRAVPGTSWFLVTKVDIDEIYEPLTQLYYFVLLLSAVLIISVGIGVALLWKNQKTKTYKTLYELEKEKELVSKQFKSFTKYANDAIFLMDLDGNITFANNAASSLFGYSEAELMKMNINDLRIEDKSTPFTEVREKAYMNEGVILESAYRTKNNSEIIVEASSKIFEVRGKKYFQSIIRDITEKKKAWKKLEEFDTLLKEKNEHLKIALSERETLLKEVHHRVKNNFQVVCSLLNLQSNEIEDAKALKAFLDSQVRIRSMILLHQQLYTGTLGSINAKKYFTGLISYLGESYAAENDLIKINATIEEKELSIETATTLGLLITEILSNSFKHAFPGYTPGNVEIEFCEKNNRNFILKISDNGVGYPPLPDLENAQTLGLTLIHTLATQLSASLKTNTSNGTSYIIEFED